MAQTQALTSEQVLTILTDAAVRQVELACAIAVENRWESFHACIVECKPQRLLLRLREAPWIQKGLAGKSACVAFTKGAFRYFGEISFEGPAGQGQPADAVAARTPQSLMRYDRRAYVRIDVPRELIARAVLCPEGATAPNWSGQVLNISRGGLQMRTTSSALSFLERGDLVQVAISLSAQPDAAIVNAYYRAGCRDGDMALVGLELREGPGQLPAALQELLKKAPQRPK